MGESILRNTQLVTHLWSDSIPHSVFKVLSNNHGYNDAKGKCEEDEEDHNKGQNSHSWHCCGWSNQGRLSTEEQGQTRNNNSQKAHLGMQYNYETEQWPHVACVLLSVKYYKSIRFTGKSLCLKTIEKLTKTSEELFVKVAVFRKRMKNPFDAVFVIFPFLLIHFQSII